MNERRMRQIDRRIERIQDVLRRLGPMRPGSLTRQFRRPEERVGAYWQISYTRHMKSRTEYVRPDRVAQTRAQIETYQRFKRLVDEWVDLAIERAQLLVQTDNLKSSRESGTRPAQAHLSVPSSPRGGHHG